MEIPPKALRTILLFTMGIALALMSAALSVPSYALKGATHTPITATLIVEQTPTPVSIAGSSDGILLMAVVIVFIIILPILWHRRAWVHP